LGDAQAAFGSTFPLPTDRYVAYALSVANAADGQPAGGSMTRGVDCLGGSGMILRSAGLLTVILVVALGCAKPSPRGEEDVNSEEAAATQSEDQASDARSVGSGMPPESDVAQRADSARQKPTADRVDSAESRDDDLDESASFEDDPPVPDDPATRTAVFEWLTMMDSQAAVERRAASDSLDQLEQRAIPFVVWGLRRGTPAQRRGAATFLIGRVGPRDQAVAEALIQALQSDDAALRHAALQAVEKMDDEHLVRAVPALIALAKNPDETQAYRSRAVRAIAKLERSGEQGAATLIELAKDGSAGAVRRACYYAIAKVAPGDVAEAFYQRQLKSNDSADLRRLAAKWLAGVATTQASLNGLVEALGDPDRSVRLESVKTLVAIGKPALPTLIEAVESPDVVQRRHAVLTIGKLGLLAAEAAPALRDRLDDPDQQVRELARAALGLLQ